MASLLRNIRLPRTRRGRIAALVAAVPIALFLLLVAVYGVDRFMHAGEVLRGVHFAQTDLEGMDADGVRDVVEVFASDLATTPAIFVVNDREFALDPRTIGFMLDADAVVDEAMGYGRDGGPLSQLSDWLSSFGDTRQVSYATSIDDTSLDLTFDGWEEDAIEVGVFDGAISVRGTEVVAEYPERGLAIDREQAVPIVINSLATQVRTTQVLPLAVLEPALEAADVDAAKVEAETLISATVVLSKPGVDELRARFSPEQLAAALRSELRGNPPTIELWFDPQVVDAFLEPLRAELELPPRDAEFRINADDTVTLVPSRPGTILEPDQVAASLMNAARSATRRGTLPIVDGAEPDFTTEEAEAMGPITKVSEFTTNHACCEARVANIQRFADLIDGMIVQPGATFSLNEAVGQRTLENGFVAAPMIQEGELVPDVGGGVSQFATTFYNAVFFGGYEDLEHIPHSTYISRYPELREATISWPQPDLRFRNDSDAIIIIDTSHTDTSITVKFFGNNGGRTVGWELGGRFNFTEPDEVYEPNDSIVPGDERIRKSGTQGWTVTGVQTISYPDGSVVEREYRHRYRGLVRFIEVHPCDMPGSTLECPVPAPGLIGLGLDGAVAAAAEAGLTVVNGGTVEVTAASGLAGLVAQQTPAGGTLVPAGSTITVLIGVAPPPDTTTTTSTTTTAAP